MNNKVNFKESHFRGTLLDLLDQGKPESARCRSIFSLAHKWLRMQLEQAGNLLPVRKFAGYPVRGALHSCGDLSFIPVDNEPLAWLYEKWLRLELLEGSIGTAIREGTIVASWKCDQPQPLSTMRFKGVKASFRDRGLKLAHINDAGHGLSADSAFKQQISIRFLRTLSPLNVFLFPSAKCCEFRLVSSSTGWVPTRSDWAEDPELRSVALGWLANWLGQPLADSLSDFSPQITPHPDWLRVAESTVVEVFPRGSLSTNPVKTQRARRSAISHRRDSAAACMRIPRSKAVTLAEAVEVLRKWRTCSPGATQLDGREGNNPDHWIHLRIDGYSSADTLTSRHGPTFTGADYNGIVNFHGDTSADAIDRFIGLIDEAEDYRDVLRPSATWETRPARPKGSTIKPKFALQGYRDGVEGFYLYHDEWRL